MAEMDVTAQQLGFCGANGGVGDLAVGTGSVANGGNGVGSQNG